MVQFTCGEVHPGCDALFVAATGEEVLRQVTRHCWEAHELSLPHLPAVTVQAVLAGLVPVPVRRPISLPDVVDVCARPAPVAR